MQSCELSVKARVARAVLITYLGPLLVISLIPFYQTKREEHTGSIPVMASKFRLERALALSDGRTNLQFKPDIEPLKRQTSNTRSPCPATAGTTAGSTQQFQLLCGSDLPLFDLARRPATSLLQCIDLCSLWHPRCDAVAYEASGAHGSNNCFLKYGLGSATTQPYAMDAATAVWPSTQEDCTVNGTLSKAGYDFQTYCGLDYPRDDTVQSFAGSLLDCLALCAGQAGCLGVSYEASMAHGYENCYLKSSATTAGLYKQLFVMDSAFRLGPASSSAASSSSSRVAASSTSAAESSGLSAQVSAASNSAPKSWIAGVVIGPLALIALLAGLVFFLRRRKRRAATPSGVPAPAKEDGGAARTVSELGGREKHISELDGRPVGLSERFQKGERIS
jgi:PAN domain